MEAWQGTCIDHLCCRKILNKRYIICLGCFSNNILKSHDLTSKSFDDRHFWSFDSQFILNLLFLFHAICSQRILTGPEQS